MSRAHQGKAPAPPTPPTPGVGGTDAISYTITVPSTPQDIEAIRERRGELSDQLISATGRRGEIAEELATADARSRPGLEQRLAVLDNRIIQLESDIAETGRQLTSAPAGLIATSEAPFTEFIRPDVVEKVSVMFTLFVLAPLAISIAWAIFKRTMNPSRQRSEVSDGGERLRRLENSVDAIAVEIERVSEGQRFVTRLLSEPKVGAGVPPTNPARLTEAIPARGRDSSP